MPKRIHFFDSVSSSVQIGTTQNKTNKSKDLAADWHRLSEQEKVYLNGVSISYYAENYNNFATEQDVKNFWEKELISRLHLSPDKTKEILAYLQTYFHQQGFMFPVSNTIAYALMESGKSQGIGLTITTADYSDQHINILVGRDGLTIQELIEVRQLTYSQGKQAGKLGVDSDEKDFVIKAEGAIHFDFQDNASEPNITVQSNKISLGRADLNDILGPSSFLDKVWDFIARVCGLNKVKLDYPDSPGM